jgi:hypothetical protein
MRTLHIFNGIVISFPQKRALSARANGPRKQPEGERSQIFWAISANLSALYFEMAR